MKKSNLPFRKMLGYSMGALGDYTAYGFIFSFLSFYLTTVAGISPAVSGLIISIAIAWDAITDPICGMCMDMFHSKHGKRRAFIGASVIPLGASIVLLFLNVDLTGALKNVYYCLIVLVFWTAYTMWNIPYYSLGAVITEDDGERTKISGIRQVTGFIGTFCASSLPTFLVGKLVEKGMKTDTAWLYAAILISVIVMGTILIMWRSTKGEEPIEETAPENKVNVRELLHQIGEVMRLKPYLIVIAAALFTNVYMSLFNSSVMYYATFCLGVNEVTASVMFTAQTIASIALVPFLTKAALSFDKKIVYVVCMAFSGIVMIAAKFIGIGSLTAAVVYMVLVSVGSAAYWMFIFNFLYDVVDADEFQSGKRKDGIIMSYYSFLLKLGGAIASLAQGRLLAASGFVSDAAGQPRSALNTIESLFTILPGVFLLAAGLVLLLTPLTRKKMEEIRAEKERRMQANPEI